MPYPSAPIKRQLLQSEEERDTKKASNNFRYALQRCPAHLKKIYDGEFKWAKSSKSEDKQVFIDLITQGDFTNKWFDRYSQTEFVTKDQAEAEWMSWTRIVQFEDPDMVPVMVELGSLETRPHERLTEASAEQLSKLPDHQKLQYRYVHKTESEAMETRDGFKRSSDDITDTGT